jgi:hypothetical protein
MKRLRHDQEVRVEVGEDTLECRVKGFVAGEIALVPVEPTSCGLPLGSTCASLVFEFRGGLVQLHGLLYREESSLRFTVSDRARVGEQRRRAARLELALPVTLTGLAEDGTLSGAPRRLVTFDVSLGGFGVRLDGGPYASGTLLCFVLELPGGEPVVGTAQVVHVAGESCGLRFEEVAAADRGRLAGYLVWAKREHTRRAAPAAYAR